MYYKLFVPGAIAIRLPCVGGMGVLWGCDRALEGCFWLKSSLKI